MGGWVMGVGKRIILVKSISVRHTMTHLYVKSISVLHITRTRLRNSPVRKLLPLNAFQVKVSSAVFSSVLSSLLSLLAGTGSKPGNDSSDTKSTTKTPRPIIVQECDVTPSKWSAHVSINCAEVAGDRLGEDSGGRYRGTPSGDLYLTKYRWVAGFKQTTRL